ncbi:GNAT family N-acetyltransferase [Photobacterium sp. DA100]|uniref:GNAT family N-acetyltransferase n=1 Tax=Photobacterium sp. DA100 TaxID=3027472 RepID=UPI002479DC85|nr:GNAT family N-acetyltransferase [Photobacterium sp. DA100]WEM41306.1 GNAT family N-acetyltransferase [Photobacterium sp. DA100]
MNTVTVNIDVDNREQGIQFEALFAEYAKANSVEIKPHVVKQLFRLPYFHGFICFVDNEPAGFAVCFESYSTYRAQKVLNIHDFMVSKAFRGKGIGHALLQGVEQYCASKGYLKITLEVDSDNIAATRLYKSCGYDDYQRAQKGLLHWQKYLI